jgi:hypothetical protein
VRVNDATKALPAADLPANLLASLLASLLAARRLAALKNPVL